MRVAFGMRGRNCGSQLWIGAILLCAAGAGITIGWLKYQLSLGRARSASIARLTAMDVNVYRYRPTALGRVANWLPGVAHEPLKQFVGRDALEFPYLILATETTAAEIAALVDEVGNLPTITSIVVMEGQLAPADRARIERGLPGVQLTQAAFISGAIFTR